MLSPDLVSKPKNQATLPAPTNVTKVTEENASPTLQKLSSPETSEMIGKNEMENFTEKDSVSDDDQGNNSSIIDIKPNVVPRMS